MKRIVAGASNTQGAGTLLITAQCSIEFLVRRHRLCLKFLIAGALLLATSGQAAAQSSAVRPRITARVDDSVLTVLRGNTHPLARPRNDQGAAADSQPMHRMLLLLQRGPDQEAALKTLLDQQQSKASANYHHWLTPQQFGQQFGPADADIQAVTDWLHSHGFQVARVSSARTLIEFSGTAGQVRNAFHTEIHRYALNGQEHFANNSDPQIPTALTPVVAGTVSLNNFPRKPQSRKLGVFRKTKATGQVVPLYTFGGTGTNCGPTNCNEVGPGDFANIYNVAKLWNPGISGTPIDGTNQTIAIVGDSEICTKNSPDFGIGYSYIGPNGTSVTCSSDDVVQFRNLFGLPANSPNVILDGPDPGFNGDEIEGDLDVEWSGAVAKNATIDFVIAETTEATAGTDLAAEYVVDNNLAPVVSESFNDCEFNLGNSGNQFEATLWEQAAAQGITVVVSSGDSGSAGCDDPNLPSPNAAQNGANVNGLASTPFNVAAGGTDFDITATNYQNAYWGGGNATVNGITDISATSYIPETTWNDSCAQNFTGAITGCTPTNGGIAAGGGGQSNCVGLDNLGNCNAYYGKPSWQMVASGSGLTAANDLTRDLPDISLFAGDNYISNSSYIICEADQNSGGAGCDVNAPYSDFVAVGGTSSASAAFAGMMALVNQNMAVNHPSLSPRQGNANYVLYNLASKENPSNCNSSTIPVPVSSACTFNDITKGNNSVPCVGGSFGCSSVTSAYGVEEAVDFNTGAPLGSTPSPAWNTAIGLDLATGLGSVNAFNLVNNWATAVGAFTPTATTLCLSTTTTSLASCPGPISITHGQTVYVNIAVNGPGGTPIPVSETSALTEDVSLVGTFPNGNPSCNVPGCTTGGVDRFSSNNYVISNADIYPLTNGTFSSATTNPTGLNYTTYLTGGTYNVVAHYGGDGTYGASDSTSPISVTVNPEGSTATVSVGTENPVTGSVTATTSVPYGDFNLIRADVVGASGQESATGTVTLTDNGNAIVGPTGTNVSSFNLNSEGYLEDQTAFLAAGSHGFQAKFNGDPSYSASVLSSAVAFTVTQCNTSTTITTPPTTIHAGAPITITAFVDSATSGNPSGGSSGANMGGTVTFTTPTQSVIFRPAQPPLAPNWLAAGAGALLAILFLLLLRFPVRRRWGVALATMLLAVVLGTSVSCGGGGSSSGTGGGGTTTLGSVSPTAKSDANGFVAGQASITITPTATETITAAYGGDTNYKSSTSTSVTITVQ